MNGQTWLRTAHRLGRALAVLVLLVYVGYLIIYLLYAGALFRWPFDYDQGEGFELHDALLYAHGEWPYRDNAVYPFYASNYPPLFHLLIVPLFALFGPQLVAGRVLSFVATLLTGGVIFAVLRREVGGWWLPALSGLAFWASNYVYQIGPLCRLHTTMVLFELLAIVCIANFEESEHGRRNLIWGLVFLLCAGYTKQLAVFTVLAALAYIFLRDIKKALLAGTALALAAGLIFWLLNTATAGQWWVNIIQANVNSFDYLMTISLLKQWFRLHPLLILLALGYLIYELFWSRLSAYTLWFFFSLATGALSGKWGAGPGYFLTSIAAAALLSGLAVGRLQQLVARRGGWTAAGFALLLPLCYLMQSVLLLHLPTSGPFWTPVARVLGVDKAVMAGQCADFAYYDSIGYTQLGHLPTAADYAAGAEIMRYVRAANGPVLSEEAMFSLLADKEVVTNPTQLRNLYENDLLDVTSLAERIYQQEFELIILRAQFYPDPILGAIWFSYAPVDEICMNGFLYRLLQPADGE